MVDFGHSFFQASAVKPSDSNAEASDGCLDLTITDDC